MPFRNIKVVGLKASISKSGKSAKVWIASKDVLITLGEALEKRPTWKTQGYGEDEREFLITNYGVSEVYDDGDDVPENYDDTPKKEEVEPLGNETEDDPPF